MVIGGGSGKGKLYTRRYLTASETWIDWDSPINETELAAKLGNYLLASQSPVEVVDALPDTNIRVGKIYVLTSNYAGYVFEVDDNAPELSPGLYDEYAGTWKNLIDPTVPSWAKASSKPTYSKSEVGLGNVDNVKQYSASNPPPYPVTSVNGKTGAVSLTASDVGALPESTEIPSKTSDLTNDSGFITGYTETDPTVPAWAKAASKPSYSKSEVGLGNVENVKQYSASNPPPYPVTSVNGNTGAVTLTQAKAFSGTFGTSGWTGDTVYTYKQSVSISGLKESYPVRPVVDISLAGISATTDQAAVKAYGKVVRFVTGSGFLTAYAMEKPAVDFSVSITVVE